MTEQDIRVQSEAAYKQWAEQWRKHAKINSKYEMHPLSELQFSGLGKAILCVANGYSLEENIETIKMHKDKVDIICCDKTLGHLLNHGITPKYCMVCDANVNYEKYMKPWENQLDQTILISNICGSIDWPANGNWKRKYFFVNKDILKSEEEFSRISGCYNYIVAGTNVSNAMVVFITQCEMGRPNNYFKYDKILLIGYDYSWRYGKGYYAFDEDGGGKHQYMRHQYLKTASGEYAYSSGNLAFSAQWFETYVKTFNLPVVNCSENTVLSLATGKLEEQMKYNFQQEDRNVFRKAVQDLAQLEEVKQNIINKIQKIETDHYKSFLASV